MKIALAQINATVGDLAGNAQKIRAAAERAEALGAHVLLTPELALTGYPPEDLLLRGDFFDAVERELAGLSATSTHLAIVIGHPARQQHERFNAASVVRAGKTLGTYHKHLLPNHTVFDEARYFAQGHEALVFGDLNNPNSRLSQELVKHGGTQIRADLGLNVGVRYRGI